MLRRFAEYHDVEGAFGRRATIERAKGILMERHGIDDARAFEVLRDHSRVENRKLIDLATAVVDGDIGSNCAPVRAAVRWWCPLPSRREGPIVG